MKSLSTQTVQPYVKNPIRYHPLKSVQNQLLLVTNPTVKRRKRNRSSISLWSDLLPSRGNTQFGWPGLYRSTSQKKEQTQTFKGGEEEVFETTGCHAWSGLWFSVWKREEVAKSLIFWYAMETASLEWSYKSKEEGTENVILLECIVSFLSRAILWFIVLNISPLCNDRKLYRYTLTRFIRY